MRRILAGLLLLFVPTGGLWFAAQAPTHILIMHTNDLHGQLLPRDGIGGIAEIAAIIRTARPDLILDAGDISTGTFLSDEFKGAPTIQAMNRIGYTAGTIGNHEFDYGQDALRMRLREAKFPILSANIQTPVSEIKKYTVVTAKGIRFGIIGLTTEELKTKSSPKNVDRVTVLDTVKTLEQVLPKVRRRSDFIVVTSHLEDEEDRRVASAFPEVRLIIGGHVHSTLGPIHAGRTLIVKTGSEGRNVGRVDLDFANKKLLKIDEQLIPVTGVAPDAEVAKTLDRFYETVKDKMTEVVGIATDEFVKSEKTESPLGDIVADAFREKGKTQIAIHNSGGIRSPISKGMITWGDVFAVLPFQNTMVTLKLTGAQLKNTLERGLVPTIGMVSLSGLRVRFDLSKPPSERVVSAILLDGTPVEDAKLYSVTTNDFVLVGGDGFTEFANGTDIVDTGIFLRDTVVDYIKAKPRITPTLDGRISFN
jgi:2',3'-cyclic-nucleotide 2'-phosphodiesterase (5'-nucleotidase family)